MTFARTVVSAKCLEGPIARICLEVSTLNGSGVDTCIHINDLVVNGNARWREVDLVGVTRSCCRAAIPTIDRHFAATYSMNVYNTVFKSSDSKL